MAYFARVVSNPGVWVEEFASVSDAEFPAAVIADLLDRRGRPLSFWLVDNMSRDATRRMVAAWFATDETKELKRVTLRFAPETVPDSLGIRVERTKGDTRDVEFSANHRDLHVERSCQAVGLARAMAQLAALEFTQEQVAMYFVQSAANGHFSLDRMQQSLCKQLYTMGYLSLRDKSQRWP